MEKSAAWQALKRHYEQVRGTSLRVLFAQDPDRFDHFSLVHGELLLDYSKNRITMATLDLLLDLARSSGIEEARKALFSGENVNWTENRPALHTALRNRSNTPVLLDGRDIMPDINAEWQRVRLFSERFRAQALVGPKGRALRTLVNIGIGGSYLGPEMILQALQPYAGDGPEVRFISNIDSSNFQEGVCGLRAEETLFVISSKTLSTRETLLNAQSARQWLQQGGIAESDLSDHFAAVTANAEGAKKFGVDPERIFSLWPWVGGRYSWCSSLGLSVAVRIGFEPFTQLLDGAHAMDQHFHRAPLKKNMPVILALLGIWNSHFLGAETQAILPYDHTLRRFPAFLQQCDMESNGKRVNRDGDPVAYKTGPILWGEPGSNSQHSFFQLLHQGTHLIPVDFIGFSNAHNPVGEHHLELMANFFAQSEALMLGRTLDEARGDLQSSGLSSEEIALLLPHCVFPGNQPSNTLLFHKLTPFNLGMLIALYEMKIFVQGILWRINSFDQWGVELGKTLAERILKASHLLIAGKEVDLSTHDTSTQKLLRRFLLSRE